MSPLGAAQVMSLYKEAAGLNKPAPKPAPDPAQKMQQAKQMSEPPVRSRSTPTTQGRQPAMTLDQIAAMPQKEFDANEENSMKSWPSGSSREAGSNRFSKEIQRT